MTCTEKARFGAFELDAGNRHLTRDGQGVAISYRCLEALVVLVAADGAVVDRSELSARLWPDTFVDDSNLPQVIVRLRRVLGSFEGADYIETVPKRGYRLRVPVTRTPEAPDAPGAPPEAPRVMARPGRQQVRLLVAGAVAALLVILALASTRSSPAVADEAVRAELGEARRLWHKRDDESLRQSQEIVARVLQRHPDSARAHALLSDLIALRHGAGREAGAAAAKALSLDPMLADAYASAGFVAMVHDWDWAGAGDLFERAVALDPRLPHARQWLAVWRALTGDLAGAREEIARARELQPLAAHLLAETAGIEYFGRNYDEAVAWARRALAADPQFPYAYFWWESAARRAGQVDEALQARAQRAVILSRRPVDADRERRMREGGIRLMVEDELSRIIPTPDSAWRRAQLLASLGQSEAALSALDEAVTHRLFLCIYIRAEPAFDGLRDTPAFAELLARVFPAALDVTD